MIEIGSNLKEVLGLVCICITIIGMLWAASR